MKPIQIIFTLCILVLFLVSVGAEKPAFAGNPDETGLPPNAKQVATGVYSLGKAIDNGREVEGYAFLRYENNFAKPVKPEPVCGNNICEAKEKLS